jgi:hypothetical protein
MNHASESRALQIILGNWITRALERRSAANSIVLAPGLSLTQPELIEADGETR